MTEAEKRQAAEGLALKVTALEADNERLREALEDMAFQAEHFNNGDHSGCLDIPPVAQELMEASDEY